MFSIWIDSEFTYTYFETKILQSKNFPEKTFLWVSHLLSPKWWKNGKVQNFFSNSFLVSVDSEYFKPYFKTKVSKSKNFPSWILFSGVSDFSLKTLKNDKVNNFWSKNFVGRNRFRILQNVFKNKNRKNLVKIFS